VNDFGMQLMLPMELFTMQKKLGSYLWQCHLHILLAANARTKENMSVAVVCPLSF
jgi:hypothetical protein